MGQPPSGIGPGAITGMNQGLNNTYTMAYGPDPDPYGAVPPYRIGYETYTPNYPGIPGVANSFDQPQGNSAFTPTAPTFQPVTDNNNPLPSVQPGSVQTGGPVDYHFYYDRSGNGDTGSVMSPAETPAMTPAMTPASTVSSQHYPPYMQQYYAGMHSGLPMPGMPNDRSLDPASYSFSPWNNGSPAHPNAGGLGRQANLPVPIGTRPLSNGNSVQPPMTGVGGGMMAARRYAQDLRSDQERAMYEHEQRNFTPDFNFASATNGMRGLAMGDVSGRRDPRSAHIGRTADFNNWNHKVPDTQAQDTPTAYANEMSRAR